ncbi:MAG: Rne/Rng family ribonuclease, partial [Micromonosporaceae bacterium]
MLDTELDSSEHDDNERAGSGAGAASGPPSRASGPPDPGQPPGQGKQPEGTRQDLTPKVSEAADHGGGPGAGQQPPAGETHAQSPQVPPVGQARDAGEPAMISPVPAATFQPPQVIFQPPAVPQSPAPDSDEADGHESWTDEEGGGRRRRRRGGRGRSKGADGAPHEGAETAAEAPGGVSGHAASPNGGGRAGARTSGAVKDRDAASGAEGAAKGGSAEAGEGISPGVQKPGGEKPAAGATRSRKAKAARGHDASGADEAAAQAQADAEHDGDGADGADGEGAATRRRRRRRRRGGASEPEPTGPDDPPNTVVHVREPRAAAAADWDEVQSVKGSTRLEAKKQRRREGRDSGRRRPPVLTESEFLARREAVQRVMLIRQKGERTQIAVLEDGVLVEHYVDRATHQSMAGNIYLGKVQNVLPSMEAAFVDIGKGRNAVLYAGEINFDASGLEGQPKRIEMVLKSGQSVLVQVTKDPVGHKGARLTNQVSLPGRYLVYVPGASMTGISRKLPATERARLKQILKKVTPEDAGVIVRTAAEGTGEEELSRDVARLAAQWENIERKSESASPPELLYSEPDLTIRVVRDIFNEDFSELVVAGDDGWDTVNEYVRYVAPHLVDRLRHWSEDDDLFARYRVDEQLAKALDRKVWLPSGGSLVVDRTEAMTVIDVNTGKFTGQGGNLEETVTRNNLEAAEEIVRQLRLRDIGGIIVIDFIDMVLESNRELVLRRLLECLARDRTKHQVAEVTSLGLVQMTRKRVGSGLLEAFSQPCEACNGRGVIVSLDLPEPAHGGRRSPGGASAARGGGKGEPKSHGRGSGGKGRDSRPAAAAVAADGAGSGTADGSQTPAVPAAVVPAAGDVTADDAKGPVAPHEERQNEEKKHDEKPSGGRRRRRRSSAATDAVLPGGGASDAPAAAPAPAA